LLEIKDPKISKPERTVARNPNPIRNGERKNYDAVDIDIIEQELN